jgi:hypothetical protein
VACYRVKFAFILLFLRYQWTQCPFSGRKAASIWHWSATLIFVEGFKKSRAIAPWDFMACFMLKFTSQKTRSICISESDQSVSSMEVVSIIYVVSCKIHRICCMGTLKRFNLNQVVGIVTTVLEILILFFQFFSGRQWVRNSYWTWQLESQLDTVLRTFWWRHLLHWKSSRSSHRDIYFFLDGGVRLTSQSVYCRW